MLSYMAMISRRQTGGMDKTVKSSILVWAPPLWKAATAKVFRGNNMLVPYVNSDFKRTNLSM